jgi:hypothetical protein
MRTNPMRKRMTSALLVSLCLSVVGCSRSDRFVLVNTTENQLLVRYRFRLRTTAPSTSQPDFDFEEPFVAPTDTPRHSDFGRLTESTGGFTYDRHTGLLTVAILPHQSISIATVTNYSPNSASDAGNFPVAYLELHLPSGLQTFTGNEVPAAFRLDGNLFVRRLQ